MTNDEFARLKQLANKWRREGSELDSFAMRQYWDPAVTALVSCALELERTLTNLATTGEQE